MTKLIWIVAIFSSSLSWATDLDCTKAALNAANQIVFDDLATLQRLQESETSPGMSSQLKKDFDTRLKDLHDRLLTSTPTLTIADLEAQIAARARELQNEARGIAHTKQKRTTKRRSHEKQTLWVSKTVQGTGTKPIVSISQPDANGNIFFDTETATIGVIPSNLDTFAAVLLKSPGLYVEHPQSRQIVSSSDSKAAYITGRDGDIHELIFPKGGKLLSEELVDQSLGRSGNFKILAISINPLRFVTSSNFGSINVLEQNVDGTLRRKNISTDNKNKISAASFSHTGERALLADVNGSLYWLDFTHNISDPSQNKPMIDPFDQITLETKEPMVIEKVHLSKHDNRVHVHGWRSGQWSDYVFKTFRIVDSKLEPEFSFARELTNDFALSPNERFALFASGARGLSLIDLNAKEPIERRIQMPSVQNPRSISFSSEGTSLFVGMHNGRIEVLNFEYILKELGLKP